MADEPTNNEESSEYESGKGVDIPEEIQQECHALLEKCKTTICTDYISNASYKRADEIRKSEDKGNKKSKVPESYSTKEMP